MIQTEKDAIVELAKAIMMLAQAIQVHTQVTASPQPNPVWNHTTCGNQGTNG